MVIKIPLNYWYIVDALPLLYRYTVAIILIKHRDVIIELSIIVVTLLILNIDELSLTRLNNIEWLIYWVFLVFVQYGSSGVDTCLGSYNKAIGNRASTLLESECTMKQYLHEMNRICVQCISLKASWFIACPFDVPISTTSSTLHLFPFKFTLNTSVPWPSSLSLLPRWLDHNVFYRLYLLTHASNWIEKFTIC